MENKAFWKITQDDIDLLLKYEHTSIPMPKIEHRNRPLPKIKKVIFNEPAAIIMWNDGSKTVVKCQPGDTYDPEKGFVMAYLKKLLGNDNTFNKEIAKWLN